jgi:hypothetical protein
MRAWLFLSLCAVGITAMACSATSNNVFAGGGGSGTGGNGSGNSAGELNLGGGIGSGGGSSTGCSDAAKLVYVLSTDNHIWSFDPANKQFKDLFPLPCNTAMQPNSMAVDRNAVAWVNYVDSDGLFDYSGAIYKVDIVKQTCEATPIALDTGWFRLGMGFSTNQANGDTDTLYVTGTSSPGSAASPGLAKVDLGTKQLVPIGNFTAGLAGESAELTGTGDAKLYGFFTTTPVKVAEIDKASGATPTQKQPSGVMTPMAWAFSFWGGSFYLYTSDGSTNSTVTKFDWSTGGVDSSYNLGAPTIIVGAGVSTCAPLTPPK